MSTFIKGDDLILYVHDGSIYRPVACLTSNSLSQTRNIIESQTKCDPGLVIKDAGSNSLSQTRNIIESQTKCDPGLVIKDAGSLMYEISFEGQYIDTTSSGAEVTRASHDYLMSLMNSGEKVTWKMDTGLTDVPDYFGEGIFADLSLDASAGDELASFSGSLSGSGAIVTTVVVVLLLQLIQNNRK